MYVVSTPLTNVWILNNLIQLEQTGVTIFQTLSGILLDIKGPSNERSDIALQYLLDTFLTLNVLECFSLLLLVYLLRIKLVSRSPTRASTVDARHTRISSGESQALEQETPLLTRDNNISYSSTDNQSSSRFSREISKSEVRRGKIMSLLTAAVILLAWILFMTTAWVRLGQSKGSDQQSITLAWVVFNCIHYSSLQYLQIDNTTSIFVIDLLI